MPRKKAATKRRTYKPVSADTVPSCGIYSTLQSNVGLGDLKFTNLPQGFSLGRYDSQVSGRFKKKKSKNDNSGPCYAIYTISAHFVPF